MKTVSFAPTLISLTLLTVGGFAVPTPAQTYFLDIAPIELETASEAFERAFNNYSKNTFSTSVTFGRQLDLLFGIGGYPEHEINRDAILVHRTVQNYIYQQYATGPILRTPDLENPFNSSLLQNPNYLRSGQPLPGSEFVIEEPFR